MQMVLKGGVFFTFALLQNVVVYNGIYIQIRQTYLLSLVLRCQMSIIVMNGRKVKTTHGQIWVMMSDWN